MFFDYVSWLRKLLTLYHRNLFFFTLHYTRMHTDTQTRTLLKTTHHLAALSQLWCKHVLRAGDFLDARWSYVTWNWCFRPSLVKAVCVWGGGANWCCVTSQAHAKSRDRVASCRGVQTADVSTYSRLRSAADPLQKCRQQIEHFPLAWLQIQGDPNWGRYLLAYIANGQLNERCS